MSTKKSHKYAIHWFRKGLRLHDNPALNAAARKATCVLPVFVIDPHFANPELVGINRYRFLLQSLKDLDKSLRKINSRLLVLRGKPEVVLPDAFIKWDVSLLTFEKDTEPYARKRDAEISLSASRANVEVESFTSHTLFDPEHLLHLSKGRVTTSYGAFRKVCSRAGAIPKPEVMSLSEIGPIPQYVKDFPVPALYEMGYKDDGMGSDNDTNERMTKRRKVEMSDQPKISSFLTPKASSSFRKGAPFVGGETAALERMKYYLAQKKWMLEFEKPKTSPNSLEPSTTVLSPYIKFGCLSVRTFWHELQSLYGTAKTRSRPPVSMDGQLLWYVNVFSSFDRSKSTHIPLPTAYRREFYYFVGANTPNYDKMVGNDICRQIPWTTNADHLAAWTEGRTGYPWIDAIMTQLRREGWIHHLARHSVACFLTRGDLWISWEEGARVFDRYLLDADWSLNVGNWMWLSASCFFYQYFRVYGPVSFGKKTDKNGDYIRKWIPQLRAYPKKYIYEPWKAPIEIQRKCNCVIGKDYPMPIVDHSVVKQRNITRMKKAYDLHKKNKGKK